MSLYDSAALIRRSFIGLLAIKPYSKISFTELAKTSGMSRQNLYNYYRSKEELVKEVIEDQFDYMFGEFEKLPVKISLKDCHRFVFSVCCMLIRNKQVAKALLVHNDFDVVFANYTIFVKRSFGHIVRKRQRLVCDEEYFNYLSLQFSAAAFYSVQAWVRRDMSWPAERYANMLSKTLYGTIELLDECSSDHKP